MEKFAGYGFNKSHAAAYALLAYHTGWLKVHFPAEFYAANMTRRNRQHRQAQGVDRRRQAVRRRLRAARRQPRRLPLRADRRQARALRPGRRQGHRAGRDRGHRRRARWRRSAAGGGPFPQPVRFLRARGPPARQQARGRSAGQGRRLRCAARRPRGAAGQRVAGLRLGRHARGQPVAGRLVRLRRLACRVHPGAARWWPPSRWACASGCRSRRRRSASTTRATCSSFMPPKCGASPSGASPIWSTRASRCCWPAW